MSDNMKKSMVLMGIDWSKAAKLKALKDIKVQSPELAGIMGDLDKLYKDKE